MAINQGKAVDRRTKIGKSISEIKHSLRENLSGTAQALLESDAAHAAVIQQMALAKAFSDPDKAIREDGKPCHALGTWSKYATLKKSALLALRKFQLREAPEEDTDLGSMVLEVTEEEGEP